MIQKMMDLLKKWFGKQGVEQVKDTTSERPVKKESKNRKLTLLDDLEEYLFSRYDFRFNVLTEQSEYALKGNTDFRMVDQRVLNTLCMDARSQGINCWDKDVSRLLLSQKIPPEAVVSFVWKSRRR